MLRKIFSATIATAALLLCVQSAHGILFNGNFTVSANGNPLTGLEVGTTNYFGTNVNGPSSSFVNLSVPVGGPPAFQFVSLFDIFAAESPPYLADDFIPQSISVLFNITGALTGSGTISGTTVANLNDEGELHWAGPVVITLSDNTKLTITLFDAEFADSFNGVVTAQFSYVPEPGTLALLAAGLVGMASRRRRVPA